VSKLSNEIRSREGIAEAAGIKSFYKINNESQLSQSIKIDKLTSDDASFINKKEDENS